MIKSLIIYFTKILFLCIPLTAFSQVYFIDNENGSDSNTGESWNLALKTIDAGITTLLAERSSRTDALYDKFYIKATDTPYRFTTGMYGSSVGIVGAGTYYFDATGNMDNIYERGDKRAKFYGSQQIQSSDWTPLSPNSSTEKLYSVNLQESFLFSANKIGRIFIDSPLPERIKESLNLWEIQNNEYYLDIINNKIYYRNDNLHPGTMPIELVSIATQGVEGSIDMKIYGLSLKYFGIGFTSGGCRVEEVSDLDVSYSHSHGIVVSSNYSEGAVYRNIESHHNGKDGIHLQGYNGTKVFNCVSYNNENDGIVLVPAQINDIESATISNCTSFRNNGAGFKIYTEASWADIYNGTQQADSRSRKSQWYILNNISTSNAQGEFVLMDDTVAPWAMFNGWDGNNNDLFTQYSGFSNLENIDPLLMDADNGNYHLTANSPYRSKGAPVNFIIDDIDHDLRNNTPDIGADEF